MLRDCPDGIRQGGDTHRVGRDAEMGTNVREGVDQRTAPMARVWRGAERTWGDTGSEEGM